MIIVYLFWWNIEKLADRVDYFEAVLCVALTEPRSNNFQDLFTSLTYNFNKFFKCVMTSFLSNYRCG